MSNRITCLIRTSRPESGRISLQESHIKLFLNDELHSIVLTDMADEMIASFSGTRLAKCIGSAISRGKQYPPKHYSNSNSGEFYYLGDVD